MGKTNTEKPTGKAEQKKQVVKVPKQKKEDLAKAPVQKNEETVEETKMEENKTETKKEKIEVKKVKKTETSINVENTPVSTKVGVELCRFVLNKKIDKAIEDLEQVARLKKAVPMKGEYAHRKGKMMSGKYPIRAAKEFLVLLKSLKNNANQHDIEDATITEAVANKGSTVHASGGRVKKRTHIKITCKQKKKENKK